MTLLLSSSATAADPVLPGIRCLLGAFYSGRRLLDRLLARAETRFCVAPATTLPALADKLDDVTARGNLVIGVSDSSLPFSLRDGDKGVVGYDVDLAAQVAKRLGVVLEKVSTSKLPARRQRSSMLGSRRCSDRS